MCKNLFTWESLILPSELYVWTWGETELLKVDTSYLRTLCQGNADTYSAMNLSLVLCIIPLWLCVTGPLVQFLWK